MMEVTDEESDLFRSITEGNLSDEQWQMFKKLQKMNRGFVADGDIDDDEDNDSDWGVDEDDVNDCDMEVEHTKDDPGPSFTETDVITVPGTSSSSVDVDAACDLNASSIVKRQQRACVLTRKYISGEINFTEFTDMVENAIDNNEELDVEYSTSEEEVDDEDDEDYVEVKPKRKPKSVVPKKPPVAKKKSATRITSPVKSPSTQALEFQDELQKTKQRNKFRHNRLPRDLQGLVGEANLRFAQGDYDEAIKMCMDVIVLAPLCPEPFQTLGMIYEELGDNEKFLQFSLISAHLSPNDVEEWVRLAEMSIECSNLKQAITCYGRAIRCEPNNMDLMWSRCQLYEQLGETRRLIEQLEQILESLKNGDGDTYFRVARGLTRVLHDDNQFEKATLVMEEAFRRHPSSINSEDINFLVELQMKRKLFEKSIKVLCIHCDIKFQPTSVIDTMEDRDVLKLLQKAESCNVAESVPIDLTVKLIVCLIRLDLSHLAKDLCELLLKGSAEEVFDLYLDVAESYMDMSLHTEAAPLLATLVKSDKFELAAVWLRYGECLSMLGQLDEAAIAYKKVVDLAPTHLLARMTLSGVLQQLGKTDEALTVLEQDEDNTEAQLEPQLLLHRSNLLYSHGLWDEFLRVSKLLHSWHIKWPSSNKDMKEYITCLTSRKFRQMKRQVDEESRFSNSSIDLHELWNNYQKMCHKLFDLKRFDELELMGVMSVASTIFSRDSKILQECDFLRLLTCYFAGSHEDAYRIIRLKIFKNMNSNRVWSLFNVIVSTMKDLRHNRFCLRLMFKNPDHMALALLNGHNALVSGSYKHALAEYVSVLRVTPDDPLINLCVGLVFIHMSCQRFLGKKHALIVQACVFLNRYLEQRGETQESYYNLGRAMHQISFIHAAEYYYLKALECAVPIDEPRFNLRSEIAFNLSLIYRTSKANCLAKFYLEKYCVL